jgi:hypothetical protein
MTLMDAHTQFDQRIGAEDLQFEIIRVLAENINDKLAVEETRGQALDATYEAVLHRGLVPVTLEHFELRNFHPGHRPSLIDAPVDQYPALAVMTYNVVGAPTNILSDESRDHNLLCSIECIVKSGPFDIDDGDEGASKSDGEEVVDRRIKRTAEAIWAVMLQHQDLSGYSLPADVVPTITWGEVFARNGDDGSQRYYWQGVRFQFTYSKTIPVFG